MRGPVRFAQLLGSIAVVFLCSLPLFAQTDTARILGSVTDQTGAAVAGATVTVTDTQRGVTRTLMTDQAGAYVAPELLPGVYKVRVEAKGFKSVERSSIQLEVAKDALIDAQLQPGEIAETVIVTSEVPLLDTTSSTLGGTLSNETINDLPLNGRNYENLLQLRPGIVRYPGGGFSTTSSNGLRAEDNAYIIEGLFNSEPFSGQNIINGAGIAGDSATILPIDAIQEFNLQGNPPAEYGWKPGTVVNVALKSGTNALHGTAYAFGRSDALDARNYFNDAPALKTPTTLEQFGGTAGGAIIKDRLFFFGGYEGQRYTVGNSFLINSPATVSLGGDPNNSIPDAIAALETAGIPISPASLKVAGCSVNGAGAAGVTCTGSGFPLNNGTNPNGPNFIQNGFPNTVKADNFVSKIDFHLNERNSINGMYFFGNNSGTVEDFPELQPQWRSIIHTRAQVVGGSWVWTPTSRWVNEARVGYNRLYQPTYPGDDNVPASDYGLDTGVPAGTLYNGLPRIGFIGQFQGLGGFKWPKLQGPDTITQFIDHISYTRGNHALKFGGELHRNGVSGGAFGNARGSITFTGGNAPDQAAFGAAGSTIMEDFFAGYPAGGSVLSGNPTRQLSNWGYAAFIQDDWRATRTLTVNIGLRYELNTVVKEANDQLGNFDPNLGLVQVGKQISSPYNGDHTNFGPRAGFAWDPTGKGNTVIRGGGGLMYEFVNWETFLAFNNSFGLTSVPTGATLDGAPGPGNIQVGNLSFPITGPWDNGPIYGNLSPSNLSCNSIATGNPCAVFGVDRNLTTPYVYNWNLNIQHAFTPNLSLEVAYVGNHGSNLTGIRDINQPPVGAGWTPAAILAGAPDQTAEQNARPFAAKFPYLSNIFQMGNIYKSNYNGLQATLTSRNYHGLTMVAGYTYSHALDDVGANWDFGYGAGLPQNSYNPAGEYASSDFDVRHRLTLSLTYMVPGKKSFAQLLEGWQLNSIVTLETAQPWGPIDLGTDAAGVGPLPVSPPANEPIRWDFFGNPSDFKSGPTSIPYFAGASNSACAAKALALDGGTPGLATDALNLYGCYAKGSSIMIPPALGTFGTMGRNTFRDSGFTNWDFSVAKNWKLGERLGAQFRVEFFNLLNHPNFANPYGGQNGFGQNDPSVPSTFGCGCATPDVAAANPVVGSGGARAIQLGLKLLF